MALSLRLKSPNINIYKLTDPFAATNIPLDKLGNLLLKNCLENSSKAFSTIPIFIHLQNFVLVKIQDYHKQLHRSILRFMTDIRIVKGKTVEYQIMYILNSLIDPQMEKFFYSKY